MAQISIEINGRSYTVGCADGEEERLRGLAKYVDTKVRDLAHKMGAVGEARLFMLACLTLADELGEAYHDAEAARAEGIAGGASARTAEQERNALQDRVKAIEAQLATREETLSRHLDHLAQRMAGMADHLEAN